MACDKNCRRIVTGGVAFGAGISRSASQSGFIAGAEATAQGFKIVVSKALSGTTRGMPFGDLPKTRLEPSKVRLLLDAPDVEQPTGVIFQSGYVVLHASGRETGLAVIPGLMRFQASSGGDIFREDTRQWWVLHINSGHTLSSHGYKNPEEAQRLASALIRRRDWTTDADDLTMEDLKAARNIVDLFDDTLGYEPPEDDH